MHGKCLHQPLGPKVLPEYFYFFNYFFLLFLNHKCLMWSIVTLVKKSEFRSLIPMFFLISRLKWSTGSEPPLHLFPFNFVSIGVQKYVHIALPIAKNL